MIAENRKATFLHDSIETFARIGTITDNVPKTDDALNMLIADIRHHGRQGFEIAM